MEIVLVRPLLYKSLRSLLIVEETMKRGPLHILYREFAVVQLASMFVGVFNSLTTAHNLWELY